MRPCDQQHCLCWLLVFKTAEPTIDFLQFRFLHCCFSVISMVEAGRTDDVGSTFVNDPTMACCSATANFTKANYKRDFYPNTSLISADRSCFAKNSILKMHLSKTSFKNSTIELPSNNSTLQLTVRCVWLYANTVFTVLWDSRKILQILTFFFFCMLDPPIEETEERIYI